MEKSSVENKPCLLAVEEQEKGLFFLQMKLLEAEELLVWMWCLV